MPDLDHTPQQSDIAAESAPVSKTPLVSRIVRALKPKRSQFSVAITLCIVAAAFVIYARTTLNEDPYASLRRDDLLSLLDSMTEEGHRLESELSELEQTRDTLKSGVDSEQAALDEAQRRRDSLEILAGTAAAGGSGISIVISAPVGSITTDLILDCIQELRDAGAEAIQINHLIRVVAQTWINMDGDELIVDGQVVELPITIDAIGDPHTLAQAMRFRGGLISQIESEKVGGSVEIQESDYLEVTALYSPQTPQYARPA